MKKNIAIIVFLFVSNILALNSIAQSTTDKAESVTIGDHGVKIVELLADETTLITNISSKEARIECYNETVYNKLMGKFRSIIIRHLVSRKPNKANTFYRAILFVNRHDAVIIKSWAKTNL